MRECKNVCLQLDRVSFAFGGKIYQNQIKFCSLCSKYMKNSGYRCICCKSNLRCKSHRKPWKTIKEYLQ